MLNCDGVHALGAPLRLIVVGGRRFERRDVLDQRPAQRHVHDLRAATDGERRQASFAGGSREGELVFVPPRVRRSHGWVRMLPEVLGADVFTAGEHESRDAVECRGRDRGVYRRQDDRDQSRRGERAGVRLVDSNALAPA